MNIRKLRRFGKQIEKKGRGFLLGMLAAAERLAVARRTKVVVNFIVAGRKRQMEGKL